MKTNTSEEDGTMRYKFRRLGDARQAILGETKRAVTPFGGLAVLVEFWRELGLLEAVRERLPFAYRSPNAIGAAEILLSFWLSVCAGARRFSHVNLLRGDVALRHLLGWKRLPGDDATRAFFGRFGWKEVDAFFPALTTWLLVRLPVREATLDLDSTVFDRCGRQEGAKKGYNPRKPGRLSHHPLLAALAEPMFILHGWLRSGNTTAGRGVIEFLTEALALLPEGWRLRGVRADSGFFDGKLLGFLEDRKLPYVVVARLTSTLKRAAAGACQWLKIDQHIEAGEFAAQLAGWPCERRFVVIRERVREGRAAVGRKLLDVPGYTYRVFVTNRSEAPEVIWRDYNQRATLEQRIDELKSDLGADDFCRREFYATEAAFRSVLVLFNLLSLWQTASRPNQTYRRPATLRTEVFLCGAIAGTDGRTPVLNLSRAWGGLEQRIPLIQNASRFCRAIPPRLHTPASKPSGNPAHSPYDNLTV